MLLSSTTHKKIERLNKLRTSSGKKVLPVSLFVNVTYTRNYVGNRIDVALNNAKKGIFLPLYK